MIFFGEIAKTRVFPCFLGLKQRQKKVGILQKRFALQTSLRHNIDVAMIVWRFLVFGFLVFGFGSWVFWSLGRLGVV